jgi:hypothetical protein
LTGLIGFFNGAKHPFYVLIHPFNSPIHPVGLNILGGDLKICPSIRQNHPTMIKYIFFAVGAMYLFFACTNDKGNDMTPEYAPPDSSYGLVYNKIFSVSCSLSGCHDAANGSHQLSLKGSGVYNAIINGSVRNVEAGAANLKQVVPGNPDQSFLYQKINYDKSPHKYGSKMPTGGLTLTPAQIEFVRQWIAAGAPLEGHVADKALIQ